MSCYDIFGKTTNGETGEGYFPKSAILVGIGGSSAPAIEQSKLCTTSQMFD